MMMMMIIIPLVLHHAGLYQKHESGPMSSTSACLQFVLRSILGLSGLCTRGLIMIVRATKPANTASASFFDPRLMCYLVMINF